LSKALSKEAKFCEINELITNQGDIEVVIEEHPDTPGQFYICACKSMGSDSPSKTDISYTYLFACDATVTDTDFSYVVLLESDDIAISSISQIHTLHIPATDSSYTPSDVTKPLLTQEPTFITQKYKLIARKVHPVLAELPDKFCIVHNTTPSKICQHYHLIHLLSNPQVDIPQNVETLLIEYTLKASYGLANVN
jgi:hypothetical protein